MRAGIIPRMCRIFQAALQPERLLPVLSRLFARPSRFTSRGCAKTALRFLLRRAASSTLRSPPNKSPSDRGGCVLLNHLQLRPLRRSGARLARTGRGRRAIGGIGIRIALGENHALPGLAGIDAKNCAHRNLHGKTHSAKTSLKAHEIIAQLQHLGRGETDVEDDLAILHVLTWDGHALSGRVHHNVRRFAAVGYPLMQSAQQVGAPRFQWRISLSASVRQARKVERANMAFMYFVMGCACAGSSMPYTRRRHKIGAMLASTSENSSLKKNGLALKTSALAQIASPNTLRLCSAVLLAGSSSMSCARAYQSRSTRYNATRN